MTSFLRLLPALLLLLPVSVLDAQRTPNPNANPAAQPASAPPAATTPAVRSTATRGETPVNATAALIMDIRGRAQHTAYGRGDLTLQPATMGSSLLAGSIVNVPARSSITLYYQGVGQRTFNGPVLVWLGRDTNGKPCFVYTGRGGPTDPTGCYHLGRDVNGSDVFQPAAVVVATPSD